MKKRKIKSIQLSPERRVPNPRRRLRKIVPKLEEISRCVSYQGSPDHKTAQYYNNELPRPRADAEKCPPNLCHSKEEYQKIVALLREAIKNGFVSDAFEGNFPRFVWSNALGDGIVYEARLTNKEQGIYKGYPRSDLTSIPE